MNKDTVVGILGAVILVAAMVAIFYYEGTQAPGGGATGGTGGTGGTGSNAFYRTANATGPGAESNGALAEGSTEDASVAISQGNLMRVDFTLTWTDDLEGSGPDEFTLSVTSPSGVTLSADCTSGEPCVTFNPINSIPTVRGAATATNGTGTWDITVELTNAGDVGQDSPVPPPVCLPNICDAGNDWSLSTELTYYEPVA